MNIWLIASLWVGLALIAAVISIRVGISVALVEIGVGVLAGNFLRLTPNDWVNFLAGMGSVLLTFLAGAEIDPEALRANLRLQPMAADLCPRDGGDPLEVAGVHGMVLWTG
jgi:Kef-type K+ transport system membrane component KefB